MSTKGIKLSSGHLLWFYSAFLTLFLSGMVWIVVHYYIRCGGEDCIPSLEPDILKIHGAAAMLALILFGTLFPIHIRRGWVAKINRGNGTFLIGVTVILIVTGYGLYYGGSEGVRFLSHWIHIALGSLFPLFVLWHIVSGRKEVGKIHK